MHDDGNSYILEDISIITHSLRAGKYQAACLLILETHRRRQAIDASCPTIFTVLAKNDVPRKTHEREKPSRAVSNEGFVVGLIITEYKARYKPVQFSVYKS